MAAASGGPDPDLEPIGEAWEGRGGREGEVFLNGFIACPVGFPPLEPPLIA